MPQTFEEWKKEVIDYLHERTNTEGEEAFWLIGGDEDMKRDGFDEGETPQDYVDYQIECAQ